MNDIKALYNEWLEKTKDDDLFEIITSSRSFIVNGIVSHDCTTGICGEVGR